MTKLTGWKDKVLFTPGPLTTSRTVKQAMLRDLGSRDLAFIETVRDLRRRLVRLGGDEKTFTAVPMQGSGTFGVEAVVASAVPPQGKLLVAVNGAYGKRIVQIAQTLKIPTTTLSFAEDQPVDPARVAEELAKDPAVNMVAIVHCETTTGILNPVREVGRIVRDAGRRYFVDAMSSFGAIQVDLDDCCIDYLVSSANKCIEGVPGFSFALARTKDLLATEGWARSVSFDLLAQYKGLEKDGQFRFTPPTHAILAFHQALLELEAEGGVAARAKRYQQNHRTLCAGMRELGFREYLSPEKQAWIITSFLYPGDAKFEFAEFYRRLSDRGYVIYPGKLTTADCFRIGNIGRIFESDVHDLLGAVREVLNDMGLQVPVATPKGSH